MTEIIKEGVETGFVSITGKPVKMGDTVRLCYVDPFGGIHENDLMETVNEIIFEYGTFALSGHHDLAPLHEYAKRTTEDSEYVPGYGIPQRLTNVLIMEVVE